MSIDDRDESERPSAVDRYATPARRESSQGESEKPEDIGPFYTREKEVRGPALALTLLLKNGNRFSIDYAHRLEMQFDADHGIEILYGTGVKITIKGSHLGKLYDDLAQNMVLTIRSMDKLRAVNEHRRSEVTGKELPFVEDITVERGMIDVDTGVWKSASGRWNTVNQQWQPSGLLN